MKKRVVILLLCVVCSFSLKSQNQGNIWYFGNRAGVNFNTNPPSALTNNQISTVEGSSSISDHTGSLLFYTNGEIVYNKNHQVMANGTGLKGHWSSAQSAIIVPRPCHDSLYYIITADAWNNFGAAGYNYNVVNMKKQGGVGEIMEKNQPLYAPSTEMLTAARHANGIDWWVVTKAKNSDQFYCYLIDRDGIHATPVISAAGIPIGFEIGNIRVSADSKKLCMTISLSNSNPQLFDFNGETGVVSNATIIKGATSPQGVEFSPDCRFLYISYFIPNKIDQFDVTAYTDSATLEHTRVTITPPTFVNTPRGLQVGPDGKIYVAKLTYRGSELPYLDAIERPNEKGLACAFRENVVNLAGRPGGIMLPTITPALLVHFEPAIRVNLVDFCKRSVFFTAHSNQKRNIRYQWDFGDGSTGNLASHAKVYSMVKDTFDVTLTISADIPDGYCGFVTQTKTVTRRIIFDSIPGASFNIMSECDNKQVRFNATPIGSPSRIGTWLWDFGDGEISADQNPIHNYTDFGSYNVKLVVHSPGGCPSDTARSVVPVSAKPVASMNTLPVICHGKSFAYTDLSSVSDGSTLSRKWLFGDGEVSTEANGVKTYANPGIYELKLVAISANGCTSDTLKAILTVNETPRNPVVSHTTACNEKKVVFAGDAQITSGSINLWHYDFGDGEISDLQNPEHIYPDFGIYNIKFAAGSDAGCISDTAHATINVLQRPVADFDFHNGCVGAPVNLNGKITNGSVATGWFWDFGDGHTSTEQNPRHTFAVEGHYTTKFAVRSAEDCVSDTVTKTITIETIPYADFAHPPVCMDAPVLFTNNSTNDYGTITGYIWKINDQVVRHERALTYTFTAPGIYVVTLTAYTEAGCVSAETTKTIEVARLMPNAGKDTTVLADQPFQPKGSGGLLYDWTPTSFLNNPNISTPTAVLQEDQQFTLRITDENGCSATDDVYIKVVRKMDIYVPGAFTPNGDGVNDLLKVVPRGVTLLQFQVYNRWGNLVFYTTDPSKGWDGFILGKMQNTGSYAWMAKALGPKGEVITKKGTVILVR